MPNNTNYSVDEYYTDYNSADECSSQHSEPNSVCEILRYDSKCNKCRPKPEKSCKCTRCHRRSEKKEKQCKCEKCKPEKRCKQEKQYKYEKHCKCDKCKPEKRCKCDKCKPEKRCKCEKLQIECEKRGPENNCIKDSTENCIVIKIRPCK